MRHLALAALLAVSTPVYAVDFSIERVASGFSGPWAVALLPDDAFLVTERRGRLIFVDADGKKTRVSGVPKVVDAGQGGLLDVVAARDFADTHQIFLTFSKAQSGGAGTSVATAIYKPGSDRLTDVKVIFQAEAGFSGGRHFGSRLVEARDGTLFVTVGDRGERDSAQDLSSQNGTVIRISRDGSIPRDNPFVNKQNVRPEIWSFGHRNPQGAALDARGNLWTVEHGAKGGDEINRIQKASNYGWPIISYGTHYSGRKIGVGTEQTGLEQPAHYWDPSIAPSGMTIYTGAMFPEWDGDIFVGSLKFDYISRVSDETLAEVEQIELPETKRVRDVRTAPDGSIWFISEDRGSIYRIYRD